MKYSGKYDFSNKVSIITGGARGMGLSHALALAASNSKVAIIDICKDINAVPYEMSNLNNLSNATQSLKSQGATYLTFQGDVTDEDFIANTSKQIVSTWGSIDILVNNAGVNSISPLIEMPIETWRSIIDINLTGTFICCKHFGKVMKESKKGRIINIASGAAFVGVPKQSHYVAAKHGIIGLTKSLCLELGPFNVTVNAIAPSVVNTPQCSGLSKYYPEALSDMKELYGTFSPLESCQILDTTDITNAVMWLASDEARFVTGTTLVVDGGFLAK